mgnify:CR=1 FL=1
MANERAGLPVSLDPVPSRRLFGATAAIHVIAVVAFAHLAIVGMLWYALGGLVVAVVSMLCYWLRYRSPVLPRLELDPAGVLLLALRGELIYAEVCPDSVVLSRIVCLRWQELGDGRKRGACWLLPDQFSLEQWRCLQVWLRHYCKHPLSASRSAAQR